MNSILHWHLLAWIGNLVLLAIAGRPLVFISCRVIRYQNRNALRNLCVKTKVHRPFRHWTAACVLNLQWIEAMSMVVTRHIRPAPMHVPNVRFEHGLFVVNLHFLDFSHTAPVHSRWERDLWQSQNRWHNFVENWYGAVLDVFSIWFYVSIELTQNQYGAIYFSSTLVAYHVICVALTAASRIFSLMRLRLFICIQPASITVNSQYEI